VASGTSSKQLNKETDSKLVGYGGMLLEGIVAVIALCTVAMLPGTHPLLQQKPVDPLQVYSAGMGRFVAQFGLSERLGSSFGLLALSAFILTTLDTATRLGRYIFEEFFNLKSTGSRYLSTLATLALPTIFVLITLRDVHGNPTPAWKAIWPVFGASNQLLAGLVLLVVAIWLWKTGKNPWFVVVPMLFMNVMTLWALVLLLGRYRFSAVGMIAGVLLLLALVVMVEAYRTVRRVVARVQVA
jgi:carbon starvation protein